MLRWTYSCVYCFSPRAVFTTNKWWNICFESGVHSSRPVTKYYLLSLSVSVSLSLSLSLWSRMQILELQLLLVLNCTNFNLQSWLPDAPEITQCPVTEKCVFVESHQRPQRQHHVHSSVHGPELRHYQSAIRLDLCTIHYRKKPPESSVARQEESRGKISSNEAPTTPNK